MWRAASSWPYRPGHCRVSIRHQVRPHARSRTGTSRRDTPCIRPCGLDGRYPCSRRCWPLVPVRPYLDTNGPVSKADRLGFLRLSCLNETTDNAKQDMTSVPSKGIGVVFALEPNSALGAGFSGYLPLPNRGDEGPFVRFRHGAQEELAFMTLDKQGLYQSVVAARLKQARKRAYPLRAAHCVRRLLRREALAADDHASSPTPTMSSAFGSGTT